MNMKERLLEEFLELVRIDSPTKGEEKIAAVLKEKLHALGCNEISEDAAGVAVGGTTNNLFAFFSGTSPHADNLPTILLSAHMDCVPPCIGVEPHMVDGIISTKGETILGGDDKSGIVAILEALRRLRESNTPTCHIQVIFTVAEEEDLGGSRNMNRDKIKADFGYVLDAGGAPGTIVYAAPGINKFSITVHGKAAHAGLAPETGINAIMIVAKSLTKFPQGRYNHESTANVGTIKGGSATNIVADYAQCVCEARSLNAVTLERVSNTIVAAFEDTASEYEAHIDIDIHKSCDAYKIDQTLPVVQLAKQAAEYIGLDVSIEPTGGGSDANYFNAYGVPTVPLGTGMSKVHTTDEFIRVAHLEQTCQLLVSLLTLASQAQ